MKTVRIGSSGLQVSPIILGCLGFGTPGVGAHPWALGIDAARQGIAAAFEAGIIGFDTANVYGAGASEKLLGQVLREMGIRDEVIVATKLYARVGPGPKGAGLSRGAIFQQVDASLLRLDTDYIDLYQIHRYDPETPIEETLQALDDLVRMGKVRYIGASSMTAWQFIEAQHIASLKGWTQFISMQNHYNLLMREEEREMIPYCHEAGVGVLPWSPLARGKLTRDWGTSSSRSEADGYGQSLYRQANESDEKIFNALTQISENRNISRAQVGLAWLLSKPGISAPVVGAHTPDRIRDAAAAAQLKLTDEEISLLEMPYTPRCPEGY